MFVCVTCAFVGVMNEKFSQDARSIEPQNRSWTCRNKVITISSFCLS